MSTSYFKYLFATKYEQSSSINLFVKDCKSKSIETRFGLDIMLKQNGIHIVC